MPKSADKVFHNWLNFLIYGNNKPKNIELLRDYFFEQFARSPRHFYFFLDFLKQELQSLSQKTKEKLALHYLQIISPLCLRFGLFSEKRKLDDKCFKIIAPHHYDEIDGLLLKYQKKSQHVIRKILHVLRKLLANEESIYKIIGRYKNIYSIFRKIEKSSDKNILNLNDIFAFRIILKGNSVQSCFKVLNLLHDKFIPVIDFFRDYISVPKINGYQSLHTGLNNVIPNLDLPIEIQIRTQQMDDFAQHGLAAYCLYAEEKKAKLITPKEKNLVNYLSSLDKTRSSQGIYFFSTNGDLHSLDSNCSILDFAYQIHTDFGHKAKAALVNGTKKPLHYKIQGGDRVKILLAKTPQVQMRWLNYAQTKHAQKKISEYLKHHD
jgi:(p)ppGpp synthase/HD superfamily hydrolase